MAVPLQHILRQKSVIASLGSTTWHALRDRLSRAPRAVPTLPGPLVRARIAPRNPALVADYIRHVGGDPAAYRGTVPPHFFPQWCFPVAARTLVGLPYPLLKVVNGGCRLEILGPLQLGETFDVTAQLMGIDDDGRRAVLHQRIVTATASHPRALVVHLYAIVPSAPRGAARGANGRSSKEAPRVPAAARAVANFELGRGAGLEFAMLTGDFNPIHWLPPYARAAGFGSTISHGFATLARTVEGLQRGLYEGAVDRLSFLDVRFARPLRLPAKVGLYVDGDRCFVGDGPDGHAYLTGTFAARVG